MKIRATNFAKIFVIVLLLFTGCSKNESVTDNMSDDEKIKIIDFTGMTKEEIEGWLHDHEISRIVFQIPANTESQFSYSIPECGSSITKNSEVTIVFERTTVSEIIVPDFSGADAEEIHKWALSNGLHIVYEYTDETDAPVKTNLILDSSVTSGDTIIITIPGDEDLESDMYNEDESEHNYYDPYVYPETDEDETEPL